MSSNSIAMWNKLPPISENDGFVHQRPRLNSPVPAMSKNILQPAHKHMQTIEGKRAMLIMDSAITKVLLVATMPKIIKNLDTYALLLGRDLYVLFQEYGPLVNEYNELSLSNSKQSDVAESIGIHLSKNVYDTKDVQLWNYGRLRELKKRIFELTREIIKQLIENTVATTSLIRHYNQWDVEPEDHVKHLASLLVQMRFLLRHELLTTPNERTQRLDYLTMAEKRTRDQVKQIQKLSAQLMQMTESHNKIIDEKAREITELQNKMIKLEKKTLKEITSMEDKFDNAYTDAKLRHQSKMKILVEDLNASKDNYLFSEKNHQENELVMRRKKWKLEDELDGVMRKMDDELFDIQNTIDITNEEFRRENEAHALLKEKFEPIKEEYDKIMEEKRLEAEEMARQIRLRMEMIKAATLIQSLYRAWKGRKAIKRRKKSSKKKFGKQIVIPGMEAA